MTLLGITTLQGGAESQQCGSVVEGSTYWKLTSFSLFTAVNYTGNPATATKNGCSPTTSLFSVLVGQIFMGLVMFALWRENLNAMVAVFALFLSEFICYCFSKILEQKTKWKFDAILFVKICLPYFLHTQFDSYIYSKNWTFELKRTCLLLFIVINQIWIQVALQGCEGILPSAGHLELWHCNFFKWNK